MRCIAYTILMFVAFNRAFGEKIAISLGIRCDSAIQLRTHLSRHYHLRDNAYPFDWVISPFDSLYKCLEEDFKNFLRSDSLIIYDQVFGLTGVMDTYYGLQFIHDFPITIIPDLYISELEANPPYMGLVVPKLLDYLEAIKEKYARRIKRFREALLGTNEIFYNVSCLF